MSGIRRALFFASVERYIGLVLNFVMMAIVSRLLTPTEVGASAIGLALITIALSLKEFAATGFLVQDKEVKLSDVRTAFTVQFGLTLAIAAVLFLVSRRFAELYQEPALAFFVRVTAVALLVDTVGAPITTLLRRDLAYDALAAINVTALGVGAVVTIVLAALGFSFLCIAWASFATSCTTVGLALLYRHDFRVYRPTLECWRRAWAFGGYNGAMTVVDKLYEALPQLVLGRILPLGLVGLYRRAITISSMSDRFVLSGLFSVAFPILAAEFRAGRGLKQPLLKAFSYVTAFHWPAVLLIGILAHPIVLLVLGPQWVGAVPLVRILALSALALFPVVLIQPLLLAIGEMRHAFLASLITLPLSAALLCAAGTLGVEAMAASQLVIIPFQVYIGLSFIRRHVPFTWSEMATALRQSAGTSACTILPVLLVIALNGFDFRLSLPLGAIAGALSICGWVAGVRLTGHPVGNEIHHAAQALGRHPAAARFVSRLLAVSAG